MEKNNQQQEEKKEEEGGDEDNEPSQQASTSTDDGIQLIVEDAAQIEAVDQTETDDDDNETLAKHSRGRTRPQAQIFGDSTNQQVIGIEIQESNRFLKSTSFFQQR